MRRLMAMAVDCPYCDNRVQTYGHLEYCRRKKRERQRAAGERFDHLDPMNYLPAPPGGGKVEE